MMRRRTVTGYALRLLPLIWPLSWGGGCVGPSELTGSSRSAAAPPRGATQAPTAVAARARTATAVDHDAARAGPGTTGAKPFGAAVGVVSATLKVRPRDRPELQPSAVLEAARNEFEPFQVVIRAGDTGLHGVSLALGAPLRNATGHTIDPRHLTFFRVGYYEVATPSNSEGAPGPWPDPLIPDVDAYVGERRNAFPFAVPAGQTRAIWVDLFVPPSTPPGRYRGSVVLQRATDARGATHASVAIPIALHVGAFTLPATATLRTAFGMDFAQPCLAHTGTESCSAEWNENTAYELRERYLRAALDHRFTISDVAFQPPVGASAETFRRWLQPLIDGRGRTRLAGARLTAIRLDATPEGLGPWLALARAEGFLERLFYYPVDEPDPDHARDWSALRRAATALQRFVPRARLALTAPLRAARRHAAAELVDIFVPVINDLDPRLEDSEAARHGDYGTWLTAGTGRELWSYQSCMSHGCGDCGEPSPAPADRGWPSRVIDSSAVQNRAFPWLAFLHGLSGELYFSATEQLTSAWQPNGLCKFSGHGDGTIFYPGTPAQIGGQTHIPVESIRAKMVREGIEDHEYLLLSARRDRSATVALARALFPRASACAQPVGALEGARHRLFVWLDGSGATRAAGPR